MAARKKEFYFNNEQDVALLLEMITNDDELEEVCDKVLSQIEDHSDVDGWSSDSDVEVVSTNRQEVIGADKISITEETTAFIPPEYDDEDGIPLSEIRSKISKPKNNKRQIIWKKEQFKSKQLDEIELPFDSFNCDEPNHLSPIDYFCKYIPDELFTQITDMTNIYALQSGNVSFRATNKREIKSFVALHIMMSCLKFPRISMYWDTSLHVDLFVKTMSRNRFYQLRSNIHLVNNLEKPNHCTDKLYKVRLIYDSIRERCLQLTKEQNLCIDEQMVPFTGHLNIKQYVKGKPNPWGIKIFVLAGQNGLAYDFLIYQGSSTEICRNVLNDYGLGAGVVFHLTKNLSKNHRIYFDNYFTTYKLLQTLLTKNLYAAGTVRINRFSNPPLFSDKEANKKQRGFSEEVLDNFGKVVLCKWVDNRTVTMASNFVGKGNEDEVERWDKKMNKYIKIKRPEVIRLYNQSMGGVDKLDQLVGFYRIFLKSRKWTLHMIFQAIDLACVNSWLEYKNDFLHQTPPIEKMLDLLHFKMQLAELLLKMGNPVMISKRSVGRPSSGENRQKTDPKERKSLEIRPLREVQLDMVDHLPEMDSDKEATRCKNHTCKGKTHVFCGKCKVHLCFVKNRNCFKQYHCR